MPIRLGGLTREKSRVGFRGDDRLPREIFVRGFESREMDEEIRYRRYQEEITGPVRPPLYNLMPGDIDSDTGVTFSARFLAASMFPLREDAEDPQTSDTYVYGVVVDTGVFDTFSRQVLEGVKGMKSWPQMMGTAVDAGAARALFWPLYAQEMATKRIPNTHIVGAVRVTRVWRTLSYKGGADFTFHGPPEFNVNCAIDRGTKYLIQDILTEYANDGTGSSPRTESGYHRSERR